MGYKRGGWGENGVNFEILKRCIRGKENIRKIITTPR